MLRKVAEAQARPEAAWWSAALRPSAAAPQHRLEQADVRDVERAARLGDYEAPLAQNLRISLHLFSI
jgi:hypothetical protein